METLFLSALTIKASPEIEITFKTGRKIIYTKANLDLFLNDKEVVEILDLETGELLK